MKFLPVSRTGAWVALLLTVIFFVLYYFVSWPKPLYEQLQAAYYQNYQQLGAYQYTNDQTVPEDLVVEIQAPRYISSFIQREVNVLVRNSDDNNETYETYEYDLLIVAKNAAGHELTIPIQQEEVASEFDLESSNLLHIGLLPERTTVMRQFWIRAPMEVTQTITLSFYVVTPDGKQEALRLRQKGNDNCPDEYGCIVLRVDSTKTIRQGLMQIILLPPWSNGFLIVLSLFFAWWFEGIRKFCCKGFGRLDQGYQVSPWLHFLNMIISLLMIGVSVVGLRASSSWAIYSFGELSNDFSGEQSRELFAQSIRWTIWFVLSLGFLSVLLRTTCHWQQSKNTLLSFLHRLTANREQDTPSRAGPDAENHLSAGELVECKWFQINTKLDAWNTNLSQDICLRFINEIGSLRAESGFVDLQAQGFVDWLRKIAPRYFKKSSLAKHMHAQGQLEILDRIFRDLQEVSPAAAEWRVYNILTLDGYIEDEDFMDELVKLASHWHNQVDMRDAEDNIVRAEFKELVLKYEEWRKTVESKKPFRGIISIEKMKDSSFKQRLEKISQFYVHREREAELE